MTTRRAEDIRQFVADTEIATAEGIMRATISMGATSADSGDTSGVESVLKEADKALYLAKRNGRNRVEGCIENLHSHRLA
jgi:diguanylate cyclase (GGDEF)-like protein